MCDSDGGRTVLCPYPGKSIIRASRQESPLALLDRQKTTVTRLCSIWQGSERDDEDNRSETYIPVQWSDVFVAGDILATFSDAVAENQLGGAGAIILVQVPDPSRGVARAEQDTHTRTPDSSMERCAFYKYTAVYTHCGLIFPSSAQDPCQEKYAYPEASRSLTGFQAQMNTSDSWPRRTVDLLAGISTSPSTSMGSLWLSGKTRRAENAIRYTHIL